LASPVSVLKMYQTEYQFLVNVYDLNHSDYFVVFVSTGYLREHEGKLKLAWFVLCNK